MILLTLDKLIFLGILLTWGNAIRYFGNGPYENKRMLFVESIKYIKLISYYLTT